MPKGVPNKRYTPEFKKLVIETMQEEKLSYSETCRRFEVNSRDRIKSWERIYLEEGPEGFAVERRGRSSKGRPPKQLPKQVEEDLLAEVQRLRAENDYLKNLQLSLHVSVYYILYFIFHARNLFQRCSISTDFIHSTFSLPIYRRGKLSFTSQKIL